MKISRRIKFLSILVTVLVMMLVALQFHDKLNAEHDAVVLAVFVASLSLAYAGWRQIRVNKEWQRFRENETWREKLSREKRTIEGIIEGSPIPTFVIGKDHRIMFWNRACADLLGYEAAEMIGTDRHYAALYRKKRPMIVDLIVDNDLSALGEYYGKKGVQKSTVVKGAYEAKDYFSRLGDHGKHLYFLAAPIYDERGEIFAAVETLQDVSREEEMASNMREYAETLQDELSENIHLRHEIEAVHNYLRSIVDSSPDTLFDISKDGIINYVSGDADTEKGSFIKNLRGKHFTEFVAPDQHQFALSIWADMKKGIFKPFEIEVIGKDGSKKNLLISPGPIGGTDRYVVVQRDITEFKNLEKKFYESKELAAIGQLSAGIAHEVRNPLSSIKMSLQILEKRMQPEGNDLKRFKIAQREVEHLEELVSDVLVYARPAALKKEPVDIRRVVENALALVERLISDKNIQVQTDFNRAAPLVNVDAAMLEQAFLNIYRNAIDAMEMNGILQIMTRRSKSDETKIEIIIEDNGCGIDPEDLYHIFNPFFTKKKYGTGLGMTQVKKIIDLHAGNIDITSNKGKGTQVTVTIPIIQEG